MKKLSEQALVGVLYLIGVPFYLIGMLVSVVVEAFMQGFITMTRKLKEL